MTVIESFPEEMFLVRHANAAKEKGLLDGGSDPELTDLGQWQAMQTGLYLRRLGVEAILHSPLERARATAAPASAMLNIPTYVEKDLRELDWGPFAGQRMSDVFSLPEVAARMSSGTMEVKVHEDAESYQDVRHRLYGVFRKYAGLRAVFITHGVPVKVAMGDVIGLEREDTRALPVANGEVIKIAREPHPIVERMFDPNQSRRAA